MRQQVEHPYRRPPLRHLTGEIAPSRPHPVSSQLACSAPVADSSAIGHGDPLSVGRAVRKRRAVVSSTRRIGLARRRRQGKPAVAYPYLVEEAGVRALATTSRSICRSSRLTSCAGSIPAASTLGDGPLLRSRCSSSTSKVCHISSRRVLSGGTQAGEPAFCGHAAQTEPQVPRKSAARR